MKQVILDTNFILSCIRNKIDFFEDIPLMGLTIVIPNQVVEEINRIAESKKKLKFRDEAKLAQEILRKNKFKKMNLSNNYVDKGLIQLIGKDKKLIIATLDRELKNKVRHKLIIRGKKKLEIL